MPAFSTEVRNPAIAALPALHDASNLEIEHRTGAETHATFAAPSCPPAGTSWDWARRS